MVDDSLKELNDRIREAPVDKADRDRFSSRHLDTLKTARALANAQFDDALNRERALRRLSHALGSVDNELSEALVKEEQLKRKEERRRREEEERLWEEEERQR